MEELEEAKIQEFNRMVVAKDAEIEALMLDASNLMKENKAQLERDLAITRLKKVVQRVFFKEVLQAVRIWESNVKEGSALGLKNLLQRCLGIREGYGFLDIVCKVRWGS